MKAIRIHNDIHIDWGILHKGEPYSLKGKNISLYLRTPFGKREVKDFKIEGNKVKWTFYGKDQKHNGRYSLELIINEGEKGMITTDVCDFVNLVPHSCMVGGEDSPNVETESIVLTSTLEYVAGGGSYDDTALWNELEKKVDKEEGLGLSEENYTTEEKEKLEGLKNYDDSGIKVELAKKAEKSDIPTKLSDLEQDIEIGSSYDDTELREMIELRNVGAEDTDESVEEPEIPAPTPSVSNEWKCVADRRMVEGEQNVEFTTYTDGTPLQAKEVMVQVLCDKTPSKVINGYVGIKSSTNQTKTSFGAFYYEYTSNSVTNPVLQQIHISASPFFTIARVDREVESTAATLTRAQVQGGNKKAFQIYEDIAYISLEPNAVLTSAAPYIKIYAR